MKILFKLLIFLGLFLSVSFPSRGDQISTPLEPAPEPKQTEVGFFFGVGGNYQIGTLVPNCRSCLFDGGSKAGVSLGLTFWRDFNRRFQWGVSALYDSKSFDAVFKEIESVPIFIEEKNEYENRPIPFKNTAELGLSYFTVRPFLQYSPARYFFVRLGFDLSLATTATIKHTKELLKFKDTLSGGQIVDLSFPDSDDPLKIVLQDGDFGAKNAFRFGLVPEIGFSFEISPQIYMSPALSYEIPLTKFASPPNDFKIESFRFVAEFRLAIKLRDEEPVFVSP